ncbi:hypothetical protein KC19_7G006900 [Ceratodon purpureus]|uniref:Uncharacterized protein n=1 Tax=Ceratodon purpureus TaxID=3225 RepID=A0A8T0H3A5_CERPU|nr:hypothetical protein KC19_7G006900 [Ceratodon purpureus]
MQPCVLRLVLMHIGCHQEKLGIVIRQPKVTRLSRRRHTAGTGCISSGLLTCDNCQDVAVVPINLFCPLNYRHQ